MTYIAENTRLLRTRLRSQGWRSVLVLLSFMLALENLPAYANTSIVSPELQPKSDILKPEIQHPTIGHAAVEQPNAKQSSAQYDSTNNDFSTEYSAITKKIILTSIDLERFSLNYRKECLKPSKFRQIRFFCAQEAGAAGAVAFEATAIKQFNIGRNHPLQISPHALRSAFTASMTTAIVAGSGSALELSNNFYDALKHRAHGYDPHTAKKYVLSKLKELDQLLDRRDSIVENHKGQPGYKRAVLEGQILTELRNAFVEEFTEFNVNIRSYAAFVNTFYVFNIATNALAATAAGVGYRATKKPKLNGPANILFIVTGAVAMSSAIVATAAAKYVAYHERKSFSKNVDHWQRFDSQKLATIQKQLQEVSPESPGILMPSLPSADRLAIYMQSGQRFKKQILSETSTINHLNVVALESGLLGPLIGGMLMTQGILGTVGYYNYTFRPRAQINHYYSGAIVGSVGASTALIGTAAWLVASLAYDYKLRKAKRLPEQLIQERLDYIDRIEKTIIALP